MGKSRRDFLKMGAGFFAFNPIDFLAENLCSLGLGTCPSQNSGLENYLLFHLAGAPPRWLFDSPLKPFSDSKFVSNPMIVTSFADKNFSSSEDIEFIYQLTQVGDYQMPHLWSLPVAEKLGKDRKLSELLQNALIIRGCRMGVDGHSINARRIAAPNPNGPSIAGLLSDRSSKELSAIGMSGSHYPEHVTPLGAYRSQNSNSLILISKRSTNYFNDLFQNFLGSENNSTAEDEVIESILSKKNILRPEAKRSRDQVRRLLKRDLNVLKEQYGETLNKYQTIISEAQKRRDLKGLTDRPLPGLELERIQKNKFDNASFFLMDDYFLSDKDLRDSLLTIELKGLAQQMALTEILLVNGLSQTISIDFASPTRLDLKKGIPVDFYDEKKKTFSLKTRLEDIKEGKPKSYTFDSHNSGLIPHHLFTGIFYYVFTNCLIEFTDALKRKKLGDGKSLYQKTLIHLSSEFGREPRPDMMGSEHGFNGQLNTFLSGSIPKLKVIGNIRDNNKGTPATYRNIGTWGEGAPLKFLNGRDVVYGNIASSISALMGIPSPTPKDGPLLKLENGQVKTLLDECENVLS